MDKLPFLIGLAGHAGVGKDTLGDELVRRHGYIKFSFSDALYGEVSAAFNVSVPFLMDRETKERPDQLMRLSCCRDMDFCNRIDPEGLARDLPHSPREILQWWGTEYRREQDPDYWLKRAQRFFEERVRAGVAGLVNVSVRFPNEAEWIASEGGYLARVCRPGVKGDGHISEKDVTGHLMNATVDNLDTPAALYEALMRSAGITLERIAKTA